MRHVTGGALAALLLLAACSLEPDAPGAISADEEQQLNDAAAMLDANSIALDNAIEDTPAR
ncbi:hypothetical protein F1C10_08320 [Sphingomonas sp. NBWT7]|uniref:hypothetical protein n=1 Tax=Sphingomonas sp. NBWT7 TaxID=2596913 RepID=UPI0016296B41|nr:hypothetical protein [Sphingomonas sp. NBWT7]QNE31940.1 hypothetical protein F1C10_08320 [Sphingomonas sp. NBWT7]